MAMRQKNTWGLRARSWISIFRKREIDDQDNENVAIGGEMAHSAAMQVNRETNQDTGR
jgi:hypothetical protein